MSAVRILVIEDDFEFRKLVCERLIAEFSKGIRLPECESIEAAKTELQLTSFDLVISDRQLPDGDGECVFDFLPFSASKDSPYIMLTGDPIASDRFIVIDKSKFEELFLAVEQFENLDCLKVKRPRHT